MAHNEVNKAYVEEYKLGKQAKPTLAELDGTNSKRTECCNKPFKKHMVRFIWQSDYINALWSCGPGLGPPAWWV
jgi:hypothetical protein